MIYELNPDMDGKEVTIAGWAHEIRPTSKITFLLLRDSTGIAQVVVTKEKAVELMLKSTLFPKESVLSVKGVVKRNKEARKGFEIIPNEIINLNPISKPIPFEITGKVPADIDVRLNYRYIDLRRLETQAIFNIQSTILQCFRDFFSERSFTEIRTPSIVAEATEGGAELFKVDYFEQKAFLAQSPQLYKQLAIIGGMDRVFMTTPVFRAEKSNTVYHLTESTQMDIEMAFANADDVIEILSSVVKTIIGEVMEINREDLQILKSDLKEPKVKVVEYADVVYSLKKKGVDIEIGHDFSKDHEMKLQELYGDAVIVKGFPADVRAFYCMPKEGHPEFTNSFDFIYKGLEISSGAQRIHMPDLLVESIKKKGLNPKSFEFYIDAFRSGAPPHSGWSIGLERLTMQITGVKNIRESTLFPRDRKRLTP